MTLLSCNKEFLIETDQNNITQSNFYTSEKDILSSLYGAYDVFKDAYYISRQDYFSSCRARLTLFANAGGSGGENAAFWNMTLASSNTFVRQRWVSIYKSINRANTVLGHINDEGIVYSDSDAKSVFEAEARFIRALGYFYLVTEWGDVPLSLTQQKSVSELYEKYVRTPKDEVYKAIYEDCKFIESSKLVDLQPKSGCGRASKVAAYVLHGKAALQQATDEDFASSKTSLIAEAKTALEAAWAKKPFTDLSKVPFAEAWDITTQKAAKENIFQIDYAGTKTSYSNYAQTFRPSKIYDATKETTPSATSNTPNVMQEYVGDKIFDEAGDIRFTDFMAKGEDLGVVCYYPLKWTDMTVTKAEPYHHNNMVVFRYADVALMLAEVAYQNSDATTAQTYLNMIRTRAGLQASTATGKALRDVILKERFREFIGEGKAWEDMLRLYSKAEIKQYMLDDNATNFGDKDYLLPIPYDQHVLNKEGMWQNIGY